MPNSVGTITLDLVIKNQIQGQLEKIASQAKSVMSAPMKEIEKSVESASKTITDTAGGAFDKMKEKVEKSNQAVSETVKEMNKAAKVKTMQYDTAEITKYVDEYAENLVSKTQEAGDKAKAQIDETFEEFRKKLGEFEFSEGPIETMKKQLENTEEKMSLLQAKWQELQYALSKTNSEEGAAKIVSQLNTVEKSLMSLHSSAEKTKERINASLNEAAEQPAENIKERFLDIKNAAKSASVSIKNGLAGAFSKLKSVGGKALNGLKNQFAKLSSSVKSIMKPIGRLGKAIKSSLKSVFLMAGLYAAFRGIKSAMQQACEGNEEFAKSLNAVKANLNIAFQPIMSAIMPALNSLMAGLAKATQTVAAFVSELFGSTYQKSLESVKQMKSAAKEAANTSKYLAGFDVMNVASDSSSKSEDDSGVDYSAISGEGVELPDWVARMKEAIKGGDWSGVGSLLAEKINTVFDIDWSSVKSKINGFVSNVTTGLNSFIKDFDWGGLGKTFAEGLNTIFEAAYTFVTTFDWSGFGKSIGNSINGFIHNIDMKKAGSALSEGLKGLLDSIINLIQTINWQEIGEKIADFIGAIDWGGLVTRLAEGIGSALGGLASLLWGLIKDAWGNVIKWWNAHAMKDGKFTIKGLLSGLWEGIKGIGTWIKEKIFTPFINGFKKVFKINSPSKVMLEMGKYIIQGLINGVKSLIDSVKNIFVKVLSTIKNVFTNVKSWFKKIFSGAFSAVKGAFSNVGAVFMGIWEAIKKPFRSVASWFKGTFKRAWEAVKAVFSAGGKVFDGIKDGILDGLKSVINALIGGINKVIALPFKGINKALDKIHNIEILGKKPFDFISTIDVPEIPKLASGGLAKAPTLAMVGDNKRANIDPEVISPLSKLKKMIDEGGSNAEIVQLLKQIIDILNSLQFVFHGDINEGVLYRAMVRLNKEYKSRTGVSAL